MYVVDITRDDFKTDMLVGKYSMDAKEKAIKYIMDYTLANHNISLDKELLDLNLDMNFFSLKKFLNDNYYQNIVNDLIVQSFYTDKEHSLFLKFIDNSNVPIIYVFHKKEKILAKSFMTYLINDSLINKYQDNIKEYDKLNLKKDVTTIYDNCNIKSEIISLYDNLTIKNFDFNI